MDAILKNDEVELKGYVLNVSAKLSHAEILVTTISGEGETSTIVANVNFKYETIFSFHTLDGYHVHRHDDYVAFIKRIISLLFEKYEIWDKEPTEE